MKASPRPARPAGDRRTRRSANLGLHLTMLVGVVGCLAAGWFELTRARAGHEIAWVYTFEWPFFALFGVYMWWRLLHDPRSTASAGRPSDDRVHGTAGVLQPDRAGRDAREPATADRELAAWEQYLKNLQVADPPGGPPQ